MIKKIGVILTTCLLLLSGCMSTNPTEMEISFQTRTPKNQLEKRVIVTQDNVDNLIINMNLVINCGELSVIITNEDAEEVLFNETFLENTKRDIVLDTLEPNTEYQIIVSTQNTKKARLKLTANQPFNEKKHKEKRA